MQNAPITLKKFRISGFKALDRTTFQFPNRSLVLIGRNGCGKSSTLQALALVREFAHGNAKRFFNDRGWSTAGVRSRTTRTPIFYADLVFDYNDDEKLLWQFAWGLGSESNRREVIWHMLPDNERPFRVFDHSIRRTILAGKRGNLSTGINLPGSALAFLDLARDEPDHSTLDDVIDWAQRIISLELLSPTAMRRGARSAAKDIGIRGEKLASFLANLDSKSKSATVRRLKKFYPLKNIETTRKRAGWVDTKIAETFTDIGEIGPTHASDGLLRLIAICAIPEFALEASLVMLDEIEDGIEPHILPELVRRVVADSSSQFIFTSHSPLLVNFFEPEDIHMMARTKDGSIATSQFSDLDDLQEGLEYFGPGELWGMAERNVVAKQLIRKRQLAKRKRLDGVPRFSLSEARQLLWDQ